MPWQTAACRLALSGLGCGCGVRANRDDGICRRATLCDNKFAKASMPVERGCPRSTKLMCMSTMMKALKAHGVSTEIGQATVEEILEARRQETLRDLRQRLRDAREEWAWTSEVRYISDSSERDGREDSDLGLIRMKADTLHRIDEALVRVRHGTYGHSLDCRQRISDRRLRALPFAARCRECEEARERAARPERHVDAHERIPASVVEMRDWRPQSGRLEE
jgi:DnaK suppressor protein